MKEIRQIIQAYNAARAQQKKAVLATVVHIEGSAYRAPGARMLITDDGQLTGAVSGGCLEGDVLRKAMLVMMEEKPMLVTYDTSDEENDLIGVSLGCNGIIRILLEPVVASKERTSLTLLQSAIAKRQPAAIVTFFNTADKKHIQQGTRLMYSGNERIAVDKDLPVNEQLIAGDIFSVFSQKASAFVEYPHTDDQGSFTAFIEYIPPTPAIVVAGAGNDIRPLAQIAAILGWDITLIDGRVAYANEERFPGCQVIISKPQEALQQIAVDGQTAILLMSHNYHYDKAVLIEAIKTETPYIGILGPVKKTERLLRELEEEGLQLSAAQRARIFGPTGFDIGAETPEEIALSILPEIKAVLEKKAGGSLRGQKGHIHKRDTTVFSSMQTYAVLLLAAGASKRLGTPKQQLIYNGDTLLRNSVHAALDLHAGATVVVVNDQSNDVTKQLDGMPVEIIFNEKAEEGMASSIRAGINFINEKYQNVTNVLIMLCDQPFVDAVLLKQLVNTQQRTNAPVVASYYDDRKGVPALFHQTFFAELQSLEGDTGAKHLIEKAGDQVAIVNFPAGAIDIDTKEAFQQITELTAVPNKK